MPFSVWCLGKPSNRNKHEPQPWAVDSMLMSGENGVYDLRLLDPETYPVVRANQLSIRVLSVFHDKQGHKNQCTRNDDCQQHSCLDRP